MEPIDLAHPEFGSIQLNSGVLNLDGIRLLYDATGTVEIAISMRWPCD